MNENRRNILAWIKSEAASMRAFLSAGPPPFRPEIRREHYMRALRTLADGYRRLCWRDQELEALDYQEWVENR